MEGRATGGSQRPSATAGSSACAAIDDLASCNPRIWNGQLRAGIRSPNPAQPLGLACSRLSCDRHRPQAGSTTVLSSTNLSLHSHKPSRLGIITANFVLFLPTSRLLQDSEASLRATSPGVAQFIIHPLLTSFVHL
ncbi:hypothetical protein GGTG_11255 [Gaeumannomyces tritici R3-111a-1]|uniref:Uncharacterized protein n=1 Tax=Gaeumannomyces tritici (strain R3-111a-1) TaxID=644352 RepID=J3PCN7_GAET3|nr:hypothetical protein GGTG_11255 [Gaeumannomyces tritici R3-111a-1]EJT72007.1 hypothetical protein GGTG_11255 [Gaeumannomyces tritici R3-111a-1]